MHMARSFLRMGGKAKAGNTIHGYRDRAIVSSVKHRNSHSVASVSYQLTGQKSNPIF